jgi:hypothetical protein
MVPLVDVDLLVHHPHRDPPTARTNVSVHPLLHRHLSLLRVWSLLLTTCVGLLTADKTAAVDDNLQLLQRKGTFAVVVVAAVIVAAVVVVVAAAAVDVAVVIDSHPIKKIINK